MSNKTTVVGNVELRHILGQGGFGKVMLGYDRKLKREVAVKVIDKQLVRENNLQPYVEREIEMMRNLNHDHVVKLLTVIDTSKGYHLVMELATNGELFDKIVESKRFDEATARNYFQQLISAVDYCHSKKIVHRDLKAENLLLGTKGELKVCDFGLSRYTTKNPFTDHPIMFTSLAGSTDYQAPEVIQEGGYQGSSCDIWSCGVILFFMLCGYLPFADKSDDLTRGRIIKGEYNKNAKWLSEGAKDLISHLLMISPTKRYDTKQIIQHPWFKVGLDVKTLFPHIDDLSRTSTPSTPTLGLRQASQGHIDSPEHPSSPLTNPRELLHQAFVSCNVDRTGYLTHDEVRDVLIKLNDEKPVSEDDVRAFMASFELDNEGRITEEQFMVGWQRDAQQNCGVPQKYSLSRLCNVFHFDLERELLAGLRVAFNVLDVEHKGVVLPENLAKLGLGLSQPEIQELFRMMDPAHPDHASLNFENFVNFCTKYDLLVKHPIAMRLRRLEKLFDATEFQGFRNFLSTGFTVAGLREVIMNKIRTNAPRDLTTVISNGETEGYLYGTFMDGEKKVLEVGIQLRPAAQGYTKVLAYRIGGKTEIFHMWFRSFRKLLRDEILTCAEDTAIKGESELM